MGGWVLVAFGEEAAASGRLSASEKTDVALLGHRSLIVINVLQFVAVSWPD